MKKIAFIANYEKTRLFLEIAKGFDQSQVFWLVVNHHIYQELLAHYPKSQILLMDKDTVLELEQKTPINDYKYNEILYSDRVLQFENWGEEYLFKLAGLVENFIANHHLNFIFGEQTWAHEILTHRVCAAVNDGKCKFLSPHTIRIPDARFAFFEDEFQSQIFENSGKQLSAPVTEIFQPKKPSYLKLNDAILKNKRKLSYFITKGKYFFKERLKEKHDPTKPDQLLKAGIKFFRHYWNSFLFSSFVKEYQLESFQNKSFVIYPLHKQPEASIDVTGRYKDNQIENLRNISRILPPNFVLLVKEHSNAIGDRKLEFYKQIKALKNTYLIHHNLDSHLLIEKASAVFTVSGTIAYEAALMKTPAFTLVPMFFNGLSMCAYLSIENLRKPQSNFNELISTLYFDPQTDIDFCKWLLTHSYEGIISDYKSNPKCMEKENVEQLQNAFKNVVER